MIDSPADPTQTVRIDIPPSQLQKLQAEKRLKARIARRRVVVSRSTNSVFVLLHRLGLK